MNLRVVSRTFNSKDTSHLGTCAAMSGAQETEAQAAGSGAAGIGNSMVPWHQIPHFEPGVTDVRVYSRKLEFLRAIWPEEHLEHLAPRAALMVEGVAFQKVSRLDTTKLKSKDGVKILVEALGGQWGMLQDEEKYNLFEKALYQVKQQPEESNDNYLARHDIAFEDIISAGVTMEEIRAYILLRQSTLNADDRKRIIVDNKGRLNYEKQERVFVCWVHGSFRRYNMELSGREPRHKRFMKLRKRKLLWLSLKTPTLLRLTKRSTSRCYWMKVMNMLSFAMTLRSRF